jgi:branched-chain amino acid transport system substrate-binding protein
MVAHLGLDLGLKSDEQPGETAMCVPMLRSAALIATLSLLIVTPGRADDVAAPGVSASEIRIGQTMPYSGPVSPNSTLGRGEAAFFRMMNDQGGVNGRKVKLISLDDGYSPPKTLEQTRKLVEEEHVALIFSSFGTAANSAIQKYLNDRRMPQLFVATNADRWSNYRDFPWTMRWPPSGRSEAQVYARFILQSKPDTKIALLYQNDDFGRDYAAGIRDVLGDRYDGLVVAASYEVTDPTIDSQIASLQGTGAETLVIAATPKFAVQAIRKTYDIGWRPLRFLTWTSAWVSSVMKPSGPEKSDGIITSVFAKDPNDLSWADDPGMTEWRRFMKRYLPDADVNDGNYVLAYGFAMTLYQVLKQCGDDLSRDNIIHQAANLRDLELPILIPGIKINTRPSDYRPIKQLQLARWDGTTWRRFGAIVDLGD